MSAKPLSRASLRRYQTMVDERQVLLQARKILQRRHVQSDFFSLDQVVTDLTSKLTKAKILTKSGQVSQTAIQAGIRRPGHLAHQAPKTPAPQLRRQSPLKARPRSHRDL